MPPSHRSHSSHHSSHHRSHHSSHHSHTSHHSSSRYGGTSHSYARSHTPTYVTKTRQVPRPLRSRVNQPSNYTGTRLTRSHKCRKHDYVYYGENWVDSQTGTEFLRGYYDENGNRYDALILENNGVLESQFDCRYCGTSTKETWTEGSIPHCPNCGALLLESTDNIIQDTIDNSFTTESYQEQVPYDSSSYSSPSGIKKPGCFIAALFLPFFLGLSTILFTMCSAIMARPDSSSGSTKSTDTYDVDSIVIEENIELFGENIYVESIGRTIYFNEDYGYYYDAPSDCYCIYSTDQDPPVWQYWYENISSDYDEYGWMEYEIDEDQWYIETSEDNWVKLPAKYDTTPLWHMTGDIAGTSYSQDYNLEMLGISIKVDDGTAYYTWDDEVGGYYVPEHDCYIYVNFDVYPETITYWNDQVSNIYSYDGYGGWLEYDYSEQRWYVIDAGGDWILVDEDYCDDLWHVEESVTGYTGTVINAN